MLAKSMEEFLERHVEKLQKDWYMTLRGNIETYAMNPTDPGAYGSITKSNNGIMISAHAYYNHLISEFDSCSDPLNNQDTYVFSFQIRIYIDPKLPEKTQFYKSQLQMRTWLIDKGDQIEKIENQPGVMGQFPIISRDMEPFIYESQCPTHHIGTKMSGHFTFVYIEGPEKDQFFDCKIDEFELRLSDGQQLVSCPEVLTDASLNKNCQAENADQAA